MTLADDVMLHSRSGRAIPIDDSAAPILDDDGEVLGGVMVFRDVTEKRRQETEIRALNAELESRVVERTAQLQAANKELEAFSYSVAHDLRAPLRGIEGFSQALIEDHASVLGADGLAKLQRVRDATERMARLIDDLLRLSRLAQAEIHRRRVDVTRLARELSDELRAAHPNRDVRLVIEDGVLVDADERLIRIVLANLLGNAWKFTSRNEHATVEVGAVEENGARGCFVRDDGAGFDSRRASKLFGAFQRLHSEAEFDGTGVGLAIVQRIVHRHGGRVWAESAPGNGATFSFVL